MDYSKFNNKLPYPSSISAFMKPDKNDYPNHESYGKALDKYEVEILDYKANRKKLLAEYQKEESKQLQLFFDTLFDEMDWDRFTDEQRSAIRIHIWDAGHAGGLSSIHNEAYLLDDLLNHF